MLWIEMKQHPTKQQKKSGQKLAWSTEKKEKNKPHKPIEMCRTIQAMCSERATKQNQPTDLKKKKTVRTNWSVYVVAWRMRFDGLKNETIEDWSEFSVEHNLASHHNHNFVEKKLSIFFDSTIHQILSRHSHFSESKCSK